METSRREMLVAGTVLTAALAAGAQAQEGGKPGSMPGSMEVIHGYADAAGVSHYQRVQVTGLPKPMPAVKVAANAIAPGVEDWHTAPMKLFTINTAGDIIAEFSDGTKVSIGKGDLVYLEDLTGKGHITRLLNEVANLFIQMPDDFDFLTWAGAQPE